jgi:hypothetical protein
MDSHPAIKTTTVAATAAAVTKKHVVTVPAELNVVPAGLELTLLESLDPFL